MVHPYTPTECDELELRTGDYIYISSDALGASQDGWVEGISWLTGLTGLLPERLGGFCKIDFFNQKWLP